MCLIDERNMREQLDTLQKTREELRQHVLAELECATSVFGSVCLGAFGVSKEGLLGVQLNMFRTRVDQLASALSSKEVFH